MAIQPDDAKGARLLRGMALRGSIAQAAGEVFAVSGFGGSSILDLAAAARVTKNQLLHYFHSKEELAAAALELARSRFRNEIAQPAMSFAEPQGRVDFAVKLLAALACEPRGMLALAAALSRERSALPAEVAAASDGLLGEVHGLLRALSKGLKETSSLEEAAPEAGSLEILPDRAELPQRARRLASSALAYLLGVASLSGSPPAGLNQQLCMLSLRRLLERS
jgi:AcrR family transcriptional regulator